ncbi:MAG: hypothetical protein MR531_12190 [Lachnospiraceae bacterium]|nr:hypothetical protein [Lachnospiraceae bacterium]
MKKVNKRCIERELQKALALEFVKEFCKQKGYSLEKLSCQKFEMSYDECAFFHNSDIPQQGLTNDIETLPQIVLLIKLVNGNLLVEETQYTKKYICLD